MAPPQHPRKYGTTCCFQKRRHDFAPLPSWLAQQLHPYGQIDSQVPDPSENRGAFAVFVNVITAFSVGQGHTFQQVHLHEPQIVQGRTYNNTDF